MPFREKPMQSGGKKRKFVLDDNKPKFYEKAGCWHDRQGSVSVPGFERVKFWQKFGFLHIDAPQGILRSRWFTGRKKPLFAFREQSTGRIIVVSKQVSERRGRTKIVFQADAGIPSGKSLRLCWVAKADAFYCPKLKAVLSSNFQWCESDRALQQQGLFGPVPFELAPTWLQGKGFGLFLDSLRQIEIASLGAKKWFAQILSNPESRRFAELRGFRALSGKEVEFVHRNAAADWELPDIRQDWMVKDLRPVHPKKAPAKH